MRTEGRANETPFDVEALDLEWCEDESTARWSQSGIEQLLQADRKSAADEASADGARPSSDFEITPTVPIPVLERLASMRQPSPAAQTTERGTRSASGPRKTRPQAIGTLTHGLRAYVIVQRGPADSGDGGTLEPSTETVGMSSSTDRPVGTLIRCTPRRGVAEEGDGRSSQTLPSIKAIVPVGDRAPFESPAGHHGAPLVHADAGLWARLAEERRRSRRRAALFLAALLSVGLIILARLRNG